MKNRKAVPPNFLPDAGEFLRFYLPLACIALLSVYFIPREISFFPPDDAKHAMDALFFRDFISDSLGNPGILLHASEYVFKYYFSYPFLSLIYYPPFYALVAGIMSLFYLDEFTIGLTSAVFYLVGIYYTYKFARLGYSGDVAKYAAIFFATSPVIFSASNKALLDVPVLSLSMMALYYFRKNVSGRIPLCAGALLAAALLTKWIALMLFPLFFLLFVYHKQKLQRRDFIAMNAVAGIFFGAYVVVMYLSGTLAYMFRQIFSPPSYTYTLPLFSVENLLYYPQAWQYFFSIVSLPFFVLGLFAVLKNAGRHKELLLVLGYFCAFFLVLPNKEPRYAAILVPFFSMICALALDRLTRKSGFARAFAIAVPFMLLMPLFSYQQTEVRGYDDIARHVLGRISPGKSVLLITTDQGFGFSFRKHQQSADGKLALIRYYQTLRCDYGDTTAPYGENQDISDFARSMGVEYVILDRGQLNQSEFSGFLSGKDMVEDYSNRFFVVYRYAGNSSGSGPKCLTLCKIGRTICR